MNETAACLLFIELYYIQNTYAGMDAGIKSNEVIFLGILISFM